MSSYGRFAYVYDRLMQDTPYPLWLEFAEALWAKFGRPRTVVDLGCGTGSLSVPLAARGYRVFGIDLSEDMLAVARQKAEAAFALSPAAAEVAWLQQDIRDWSLPEPADTVVSFCDCFCYLLEEEDVERGFRRAFAGLKPGGLFLFDVHTPFQLRSYAENEPFLLNEDDIAYIWTSELDEDKLIITHDLTIFAQDAGDARGRFHRIDETHRQRAYSLDWLDGKLREAGFAEVERFADFGFAPPGPATERAFFAAIKR